MGKDPTMVDVAREAGVALKTVSRFVNGETNINPAMQNRIAEAIQTLGYRRNLAAASIRPGQMTRVLGLVIGDISNPFYSTLTRAIESVATARGFMLISASSEEDGATHDRLVSRLLEQRVDGLIVVPPRVAGQDWSTLNPNGAPVVFVDRPAVATNYDTVLADNFGGAKSAAEILLQNGARNVAFVGDRLDIYTMSERLRGYRAALKEAGVPAPPEFVRTHAHDAVTAAADVTSLLAVRPDLDAVFAANNRATLGTLIALRSVGRRLPLIGFDEFEAAALVDPAVSVVLQDIAAMGGTAVEFLLSRIGHDAQEPRSVTLPTRLVLRGSER
jgi:LacI family transcriptional regulator